MQAIQKRVEAVRGAAVDFAVDLMWMVQVGRWESERTTNLLE